MKRTGALTKIDALFAKYQQTLRPPQASVERVVCAAINEIVGCNLTPSQIHYTVATKTISISAPSLLKHEIKLVLPDIEEKIVQNLGPQAKIVFV
jgi:hypothetical protein